MIDEADELKVANDVQCDRFQIYTGVNDGELLDGIGAALEVLPLGVRQGPQDLAVVEVGAD